MGVILGGFCKSRGGDNATPQSEMLRIFQRQAAGLDGHISRDLPSAEVSALMTSGTYHHGNSTFATTVI